MNIREMCLDDLEQVCILEQEMFSSPWSQKSFADAIANPSNIYLVAEEEKDILGYCGMWGIAGEGQITNVAVKKTCRKKCIGKQMLELLLQKGEKNGIVAFSLEVRESNHAAIALYEKFNFINAGVRKNYYEKPTENAVIMWKNQER